MTGRNRHPEERSDEGSRAYPAGALLTLS
jgi:hypothetical protein